MPRMRIALIALIALCAAAAAAESAKRMSVNVKETQVRSSPSYLGKVLGTLAYADEVQVLESKKDWARVSAPKKGLEGWINT